MTRALLHGWRDGWRRLRPAVRLAIPVALLLALGCCDIALIRRQAVTYTPAVSVRLAGPPAAANAKTGAADLRAQLNARAPLPPAPRDEFLATAPEGRVPRKSDTGAAVWQAYAASAPTLPATTPRLAVLLVEVGLPGRNLQPALDLPGAVTLAIDSAAADPAGQIAGARAAGHEAAFDLPLSPAEPGDLGPEALRWDDPAPDNLHKLRLWLARSPGAFAVLAHNGAGFTGNGHALAPVMQDLALRGLGWIAASTASGDSLATARNLAVPAVQGTVDLDAVANADAIATVFKDAVARAKQGRAPLIVAHAYPVTLQALADLLPTLPDAGVALVPVSALLAVKAGHD